MATERSLQYTGVIKWETRLSFAYKGLHKGNVYAVGFVAMESPMLTGLPGPALYTWPPL